MIEKRFLLALVAVACLLAPEPLAASGPELVKYKDWTKSPEFVYLATPAEAKEWKKVASDADAEKFVALFWARRNPSPTGAGKNEFREAFEARVEFADKDPRFRIAKGGRGSLTERGKLFVLVGQPKNIAVIPGTLPIEPGGPHAEDQTSSGSRKAYNEPGTSLGESIMKFQYEPEQLPAWAGVKYLVASFAVEQTRDSLLGPADVRRIENEAARQALKHPDLKEVPAEPAAASAAPAPKASSPAGPAVSAAANDALNAALEKIPSGAAAFLPVAYSDGSVRLMMQAYVEGSAPAAPVRSAWVARGKDGKEAARGEDAADAQTAVKGSVFGGAVAVPPGDYDAAFVLLDASGAVVRSASRSVSIPAPGAELGASPLFLAIADVPAEGAKGDAPFVFAGRRFVSRGEDRFQSGDGLSYLLRVYGAGVDPATKKAFVKRRIKIQRKGGGAIDVPASADEPVAVAEGGVSVIDVAGTVADKDIGTYFRPGDYTFTIQLEDTVKGTKKEASALFSVLPKPK